ncbi:hypothetical protein [Bradyrhizobium manausense]|uniref:hypothetical protein n=1 Tax=Bradyrhizobium manausense TaxID=989370 RepID=UPI0012EECB8A|nr:hypothetical protein [Bradyrhizobium manausense]
MMTARHRAASRRLAVGVATVHCAKSYARESCDFAKCRFVEIGAACIRASQLQTLFEKSRGGDQPQLAKCI